MPNCNAASTAAALVMAGMMLIMTQTATAQTTRTSDPGGTAPPPQDVTVETWTCPSHKQMRMPSKGTCPMCDRDLVVMELHLHGPEPLGDPYPLDTCPVSGEKLGSMGDPLVLAYDGREVRLCCKGCVRSFEKDPDKYWAEIDQRIAKQQQSVYPLQTCPVSGESLTAMGKPVELIYKNRLVRLCCNMCKKDFMRTPAKFLAKLDAAVISNQREHYPLETCMVSGGKLDSMGGPIEVVFGNRLVRFCCAGCLPAFWKDPAKYYRQLDEAWAKHGHKPGPADDEGKHGDGSAKEHDHNHDHGDDHDH